MDPYKTEYRYLKKKIVLEATSKVASRVRANNIECCAMKVNTERLECWTQS